jgi:hypothetical protein
MCWACEEQELLYRYELEVAVARGVMPEGFTAADFEAAGLPVPGQTQAQQAQPEQKAQPAKSPLKRANAFVCDEPDKE